MNCKNCYRYNLETLECDYDPNFIITFDDAKEFNCHAHDEAYTYVSASTADGVRYAHKCDIDNFEILENGFFVDELKTLEDGELIYGKIDNESFLVLKEEYGIK